MHAQGQQHTLLMQQVHWPPKKEHTLDEAPAMSLNTNHSQAAGLAGCRLCFGYHKFVWTHFVSHLLISCFFLLQHRLIIWRVVLICRLENQVFANCKVYTVSGCNKLLQNLQFACVCQDMKNKKELALPYDSKHVAPQANRL